MEIKNLNAMPSFTTKDGSEIRELLAHRWLGFGDADMETLLRQAGLQPGPPVAVSGALAIRLWPARRAAAGAARTELVA